MGKFAFVRSAAAELIRDVTPGMEQRYDVKHVTDDAEIMAVRQFQTSHFAKLGKISLDQVENGVPRNDRSFEEGTSHYHVAIDTHLSPKGGDFDLPLVEELGHEYGGRIVVASRTVWGADLAPTDLRLPLRSIDSPLAQYISNLPPGSVADLGSFAKDRGTSPLAAGKTLKGVIRYVSGLEPETQEKHPDVLVFGLEEKAAPYYQEMYPFLTPLTDELVSIPGIKANHKGFAIEIANIKEALQKRGKFGIRQYMLHELKGCLPVDEPKVRLPDFSPSTAPQSKSPERTLGHAAARSPHLWLGHSKPKSQTR